MKTKETSHSFDVAIAVAVGVEKAIMLKEILFWQNNNQSNGRNFHDGRYWTYNTADAYATKFPYFSRRSISRWLKQLYEECWIYEGNYSPNPYDRTKSHSVNHERYNEVMANYFLEPEDEIDVDTELATSSGQNGQCTMAKMANGECQSGQSISTTTQLEHQSNNSIGSSIEQPTPATPLQPSKVDVQNEDKVKPKSSKPTSHKVIAPAANFEPPTFEQVKEGFEALIRAKAKLAIPTSIELHAASNAEAFFLCYEPKGWKVKTSGRMQPMKSWRLAIAQWFNRENAQGRYNRPHGNDLAHQNKQKQERLQPAPAVLASSPFSRKVG